MQHENRHINHAEHQGVLTTLPRFSRMAPCTHGIVDHSAGLLKRCEDSAAQTMWKECDGVRRARSDSEHTCAAFALPLVCNRGRTASKSGSNALSQHACFDGLASSALAANRPHGLRCAKEKQSKTNETARQAQSCRQEARTFDGSWLDIVGRLQSGFRKLARAEERLCNR